MKNIYDCGGENFKPAGFVIVLVLVVLENRKKIEDEEEILMG